MYSHCLFCGTPFGSNTELEHLPVGRRVAFDDAQGQPLGCLPELRPLAGEPVPGPDVA